MPYACVNDLRPRPLGIYVCAYMPVSSSLLISPSLLSTFRIETTPYLLIAQQGTNLSP